LAQTAHNVVFVPTRYDQTLAPNPHFVNPLAPTTGKTTKNELPFELLNSLKTVTKTISPHHGLLTGPLTFHQFIPLVFAVDLCGRTLAMAPGQSLSTNSPSIPVFLHKLRQLPGNRDSTDLPSRCT
jgi:hypothetical protein